MKSITIKKDNRLIYFLILILRYIVLFSFYFPIFYLIVFHTLYLKVVFYLGREPYWDHPDPETLSKTTDWFDKYAGQVWTIENLLPYSIGIIFIYGIFCIVLKRNVLKISKIHFMVLLISFVLFIFSLGRIFWLVD